MSVVEAPAIRETLRGTLRDRVTPEVADEAVTLLMEAMRSPKKGVGHCSHCKRDVSVLVSDARAASVAFETLIAHCEGKATTAHEAEQESLTVARSTYPTLDAAHALALLDAGQLDALRLELQSSL